MRMYLSKDYDGITVSKAGVIRINDNKIGFNVKELVPANVWHSQGSHAIGFLHPELIRGISFYRQYWETTVYINTWSLRSGPGNFELRCLRPLNSIGATFSRHKYGMAFDSNVRGLPATEVYKRIMEYPKPFLQMGFTTIEDIKIAKTWTHLDIRRTGLIDELLVVRP